MIYSCFDRKLDSEVNLALSKPLHQSFSCDGQAIRKAYPHVAMNLADRSEMRYSVVRVHHLLRPAPRMNAHSTAVGSSESVAGLAASLLNGKAYPSGDMALRIEKAFRVKMDTLMRMQSLAILPKFDIAQTRKRENQIRVPRISVLAATH
jgi:hypothetical protein